MARWAQGAYTPKNSEKYIGKGRPKYRSGWELSMMRFLDENKNIIYWASESLRIPYKNPLTGKISSYVPDFFIVYEDKKHTTRAEVIEVKPRSQTSLTEARSKQEQAQAIINQAKFAAANAYCHQQGYVFRVVTEDDIFANTRSKRGKR